MTNTHRIVVGVGGSAHAHPAIEWALEYAPSVQAEVELVHVVDLNWRTNPAPFAESAVLKAEQELRALATHFSDRTGSTVHATVLVGHEVESLVEHSAGAHLLVIGTHRPKNLGDALFSVIAARVAAKASVSTVVVPHLTTQGRGIVAGVDDSEFSVAPLAFAAREADRRHEPLRVVHSWHAPQPWTDGEIVDWPVAPEEEEQRILAEAVAGIAQTYPDLEVHTEVVFARAVDALYEAAKGARMLVVGSHGRHGFEKAWLGSTSEELVLAAPTTVAVIR